MERETERERKCSSLGNSCSMDRKQTAPPQSIMAEGRKRWSEEGCFTSPPQPQEREKTGGGDAKKEENRTSADLENRRTRNSGGNKEGRRRMRTEFTHQGLFPSSFPSLLLYLPTSLSLPSSVPTFLHFIKTTSLSKRAKKAHNFYLIDKNIP